MTTTGQKTKLLTADDLLRLYSQGVRGELIRGVLYETMPTGGEHGAIAMKLGFILCGFIWPQRLGRLVGSDSGVLLERDPDTVREPDVAFISASKRPLNVSNTGYTEFPPDLVVEIESPSDRASEVDEKARVWLSYGVHLVWVVHPEARTVEVYEPDAPIVTLTGDDTLDGGAVLPGFSCTVRDIFEM